MRHSYIFIPLSLFMERKMISKYDWYVMGVCVFLLVAYIVLTLIDRGDTK